MCYFGDIDVQLMWYNIIIIIIMYIHAWMLQCSNVHVVILNLMWHVLYMILDGVVVLELPPLAARGSPSLQLGHSLPQSRDLSLRLHTSMLQLLHTTAERISSKPWTII